ncbi:hypothetical protein [Nevskia ramosa]|uniref:hypothetical protein n=1 Tax=Nevskia ramosa TaxID=64002 RepID=UPI003D0C7385
MSRRSTPSSGHGSDPSREVIAEAARIICEEDVLDYRSAKLKALQRLGQKSGPGSRGALPDNASIQAAVIEYQRIFGGSDYAGHLIAMRRAAVQAMKLLQPGFSPRLVGAVVSGAITYAHRVQIHGFADRPETLDFFLQDRGIPFEQDERDYRYPDGTEVPVPLARFEAGEIGIDIAMFGLDDLRRTPLSPSDGLPMKRLNLADAEALAAVGIEAILGSPTLS